MVDLKAEQAELDRLVPLLDPDRAVEAAPP
jgi:hypothetical protein